MKMLTATVKNATLTPAEFNYFCFYLQMAWPCKQMDDGVVLESIPTEGIYHYPKGTNAIVTAEEFMRLNIRRVCEKVITHHGGAGDVQKSYILSFSYAAEASMGECGRFTPEKSTEYPLCDNQGCMMSEICGASANMTEPEWQSGA